MTNDNTLAVLKEAKTTFLDDVLKGLNAEEKHLDPKYFYDTRGNQLFQQIMHCEEYYPYRSELEILSSYSAEIASTIIADGAKFDLVELGAGDCSKTDHLLTQLLLKEADFSYQPIDISENVIADLNLRLPMQFAGLKIEGFCGDYFSQLEKIYAGPKKRKVILFLGSNLGNMPVYNAIDFCRRLRSLILPGDMFIIGMDLKKNPFKVLAAYNDKAGITRAFNLNLLERINHELGGDFDLQAFAHFPTYDPQTGTCKSFLVSTKNQVLKLQGMEINFYDGEHIHMEISQKYSSNELDEIAEVSSFRPLKKYYDHQKWFTDVIWSAI